MNIWRPAFGILASVVVFGCAACIPGCSATAEDDNISPKLVRRICGITVELEGEAEGALAQAADHAALRACKIMRETIGDVERDDLLLVSQFSLYRAIEGFCHERSLVLDVRCFDPLTKEMRYLIWLNVENGAALLWGAKQNRPTIVPPPPADEWPTLRVTGKMTIVGAKVATRDDALASIQASFPHQHQKDFRRSLVSIRSVPRSIPGFAKKGDQVWQGTCETRFGHKTLLWVHAQTGELYSLTEPWVANGDGRAASDKVPNPFGIKNPSDLVLNVRDTTDANAAIVSAFASYMSNKELHTGPNSIYGMEVRYVTTLGFDIPGFAKRGDRIWECCLCCGFGGVRQFIWVNPKAGKAFFLNHMFEQAQGPRPGAKQ